MVRTDKYIDFGFISGNPERSMPTDTFAEMQTWRNDIPIEIIIKHIETLQEGLMCGEMATSIDAVTGEGYPAGQYKDGPFFFPIDVLRYLKRGDIHGVPKEYEEYLKETYHLGE